jgi:hypothetical protein
MALDEAALAEVKRLHQENELTLVEIGVRNGVSASTISRWARVHEWPSRTELLGWAPRSFSPVTALTRARLVRRFYDAMSKRLEQMVEDMAEGRLSAEEFENGGKAVAAMFGSVAKAAADLDGEKKHKAKAVAPAPVSAGPSVSDDVERLHREIVERFERIQRRRNAEAGSG